MNRLTVKEGRYLKRQIGNKKAFLVFSILGVCAGLAYLGYMLISEDFRANGLVLMVFILLQARSNLKQFKDAALLEKLAAGCHDKLEKPTTNSS